jgi:hypothetical protein
MHAVHCVYVYVRSVKGHATYFVPSARARVRACLSIAALEGCSTVIVDPFHQE